MQSREVTSVFRLRILKLNMDVQRTWVVKGLLIERYQRLGASYLKQ